MWELTRRASSRVSPLALRLYRDSLPSTRHYPLTMITIIIPSANNHIPYSVTIRPRLQSAITYAPSPSFAVSRLYSMVAHKKSSLLPYKFPQVRAILPSLIVE